MDADFLSNKTILILSPQSWGGMLISKHHYAIELTKRGNEVYFLNPPDNHQWSLRRKSSRISIMASGINSNLFLIEHKLYYPYNIKFHSRPLYNILVRKQIRDILSVIKKPLDIIWSFDLGNLFPLSYFNRSIYKVFHPVDEPGDRHAILAGSGADVIFSVTKEIIKKYKHYNIPSYFMNHGLANEFIIDGLSADLKNNFIRAGMSGNLLRADLDRPILLRIVAENPLVQFHFYGSYQSKDSNIGTGDDEATINFITQLKSFQNIFLHGVLNTRELAVALNQMDTLLICYDIERDQSKGTNYHKVMEYLSTGKVIISNNITAYDSDPVLVTMVRERDSNRQLPALFKEVISNLDRYNDGKRREYRVSYARDNLYSGQLEKMNETIVKLIGKDRFTTIN